MAIVHVRTRIIPYGCPRCAVGTLNQKIGPLEQIAGEEATHGRIEEFAS